MIINRWMAWGYGFLTGGLLLLIALILVPWPDTDHGIELRISTVLVSIAFLSIPFGPLLIFVSYFFMKRPPD